MIIIKHILINKYNQQHKDFMFTVFYGWWSFDYFLTDSNLHIEAVPRVYNSHNKAIEKASFYIMSTNWKYVRTFIHPENMLQNVNKN
jgi:hypothetical protein